MAGDMDAVAPERVNSVSSFRAPSTDRVPPSTSANYHHNFDNDNNDNAYDNNYHNALDDYHTVT